MHFDIMETDLVPSYESEENVEKVINVLDQVKFASSQRTPFIVHMNCSKPSGYSLNRAEDITGWVRISA